VAGNLRSLLGSSGFLIKPGLAVVGLIILVIGYNALADSRMFEITRLELTDVTPDLRADVEQVVRRTVSQTRLLSVDLPALRRRIEELPRVRQANVARILPDGIYVSVVERKPAVLARRQSESVVWLDADGVEIGDLSDVGTEEPKEIPPIVKGFNEGTRSETAIKEDQERIALYSKIEVEFKSAEHPLWQLLSEIDLTYLKSVSMRLANSPVTVVVGNKDFRNRFETAVKVLEAIRLGDAELVSRFRVQDPVRLIQNRDRINFIDTSRPDRIVLNFSTPGKEIDDQASIRHAPKPARSTLATGARGNAQGTQTRPRRTSTKPEEKHVKGEQTRRRT
jgi:hypothetical protein